MELLYNSKKHLKNIDDDVGDEREKRGVVGVDTPRGKEFCLFITSFYLFKC
jgi:hypothetical protein